MEQLLTEITETATDQNYMMIHMPQYIQTPHRTSHDIKPLSKVTVRVSGV